MAEPGGAAGAQLQSVAVHDRQGAGVDTGPIAAAMLQHSELQAGRAVVLTDEELRRVVEDLPGRPANLQSLLLVPLALSRQQAAVVALASRSKLLAVADCRTFHSLLATLAQLMVAAAGERERARAEHASQESAQRMAALISSVADGIVLIDERRCMLKINPAAERMFDYSAAELLGSGWIV